MVNDDKKKEVVRNLSQIESSHRGSDRETLMAATRRLLCAPRSRLLVEGTRRGGPLLQ